MRIRTSRYAPETLAAVADARETLFRRERNRDERDRQEFRELAEACSPDWLSQRWEEVFGEALRRA